MMMKKLKKIQKNPNRKKRRMGLVARRFLLGFAFVLISGVPAILKNIQNPVTKKEEGKIKVVGEYEDVEKYK